MRLSQSSLWRVPISAFLSLALLASVLISVEPTLAEEQTALERAIADSDIAALRAALKQDPTAPSATVPHSVLMQAIEMLAKSTPSNRKRAREVIRMLVSSGASISKPFETVLGEPMSMPTTWIARISGESRLAEELIGNAPGDVRCALIIDMADDGNKGQWENAVFALKTVPVRKRSSTQCLGLFRLAIRTADYASIPDRIEPLFSAGMTPTPADAARILTFLPAGTAAKQIVERILKVVDLDSPLPRETFEGYSYRPASLFAYLVNTSLNRFSTPLQQNLASIPEWKTVLSRHERREEACVDQNMADAFSSWSNADFKSPPDMQEKRTLLRDATGWLILHCEPALLRSLSWANMMRLGSSDLVAEAIAKGVPFSDPKALTNIAICQRDAAMTEHLMLIGTFGADLNFFFACLTPMEVKSASDEDQKILSWLLRHGADPNATVADAAPLAIAHLYGRGDVAEALIRAGATSATVSDDAQYRWLNRLLRLTAGFQPDPLPFEEEYENTSWGMNSEEKDLDGDGHPEYIVWDNCGAADCDFALLRKDERRWREVLSAAGNVMQLETRHHGWFDLSVAIRLAAARYETTIYRFDGAQYQPWRCEQTTYESDGDPIVTQIPCPR